MCGIFLYMIFSSKESLEDRLVRYLSYNNHNIDSFVQKLKSDNLNPTIQGIYKSLRFLISEEIVIKHKEIFLLSEDWKEKIVNEFSTKQNIDLSEGESMQFNLSSLIHLDQQWKNIIIPIHSNIKRFPVFFYNPHDIWSFLGVSRKESEDNYFKNFLRNKIFVFSLSGGSTQFDKHIQEIRKNNYTQIILGDKTFKETDYYTVIGDYVTIVRVSKKTASAIENCYIQSKDIYDFQKNIKNIGFEKKHVKLVIERNKEKAKKLRKRMAKDFYVPRELRERFELF